MEVDANSPKDTKKTVLTKLSSKQPVWRAVCQQTLVVHPHPCTRPCFLQAPFSPALTRAAAKLKKKQQQQQQQHQNESKHEQLARSTSNATQDTMDTTTTTTAPSHQRAGSVPLSVIKRDGDSAADPPPRLPTGPEPTVVDVEYIPTDKLEPVDNPSQSMQRVLNDLTTTADWYASCCNLKLLRQLVVHHKGTVETHMYVAVDMWVVSVGGMYVCAWRVVYGWLCVYVYVAPLSITSKNPQGCKGSLSSILHHHPSYTTIHPTPPSILHSSNIMPALHKLVTNPRSALCKVPLLCCCCCCCCCCC